MATPNWRQIPPNWRQMPPQGRPIPWRRVPPQGPPVHLAIPPWDQNPRWIDDLGDLWDRLPVAGLIIFSPVILLWAFAVLMYEMWVAPKAPAGINNRLNSPMWVFYDKYGNVYRGRDPYCNCRSHFPRGSESAGSGTGSD